MACYRWTWSRSSEPDNEFDDQFVPDSSVGESCNRFMRGAPGLAEYLARKGLAYVDVERHHQVTKRAIHYCRCGEASEAPKRAPKRAPKLASRRSRPQAHQDPWWMEAWHLLGHAIPVGTVLSRSDVRTVASGSVSATADSVGPQIVSGESLRPRERTRVSGDRRTESAVARENLDPVSLQGTESFEVESEVESIEVLEYHPLANGEAKPTQVHLWMGIAGSDQPFAMRFRSGRPIDELIVALITHRKAVFGGG